MVHESLWATIATQSSTNAPSFPSSAPLTNDPVGQDECPRNGPLPWDGDLGSGRKEFPSQYGHEGHEGHKEDFHLFVPPKMCIVRGGRDEDLHAPPEWMNARSFNISPPSNRRNETELMRSPLRHPPAGGGGSR
mgnify:CR=1